MHISTRTIFRHLWRHRLFTLLNIIGLAIGISACWIIYGIISYEFSYENKIPQKDKIFRLVSGFVFDEKESYNGGVSAPVYAAIREQVPAVKRAVPVFGKWMNTVKSATGDVKQIKPVDDPENIIATDSTYFAMVPYTWIAGNAATALSAPENVVLTESRARSYFNDADLRNVIGRILVYNDTISKKISGIVKDLSYPTEFIGQEFFKLEPKVYPLNSWTNTNGNEKVYLQLAKASDTAQVLSQITNFTNQKWKEFKETNKPSYTFTRWFELVSLRDSHFSTFINEHDVRKASMPVLYGLMGLAGFLLLLACINYINLSTAQIPQRSKEIGVRKILGSSRWYLTSQLLMETLFTVAMAALLSVLLAQIGFRLLRDMIPANAEQSLSVTEVIGFLAILVILVSVLSGSYPAWLIARVQPLMITKMKANWSGNRKRLSPRKALIIVQFVIAQVFIAGALIMGSQLKYTIQKDMGFNKDAVVLIDVPWKLARDKAYEGKQFALANELRRDPQVQLVSLGNEPMSGNYSSGEYEYVQDNNREPIKRQVFRKAADTNYIRLYGMHLLAGRNLHASDTVNELVINETAMHAFGFKSPLDAIGKLIGQSDGKYPIVGVVKDFHLQDFHTTIDPVALMSEKDNMNTFNIKLSGNDTRGWRKTIAGIEAKWNSFYPTGTFDYKFYDETVAAMYEQEHRLSKLVNLATVIALLISCLGLFGLATLTAYQRTKEIGIRKVLGASVPAMVRMLSLEFISLIVIALLIATPLAWWFMQRWLEGFAYRIQIQWWMFLLAGVGAVCIALLTVGYQAVRAAVANPVKSLRTE